jgi:hypothetical protein
MWCEHENYLWMRGPSCCNCQDPLRYACGGSSKIVRHDKKVKLGFLFLFFFFYISLLDVTFHFLYLYNFYFLCMLHFSLECKNVILNILWLNFHLLRVDKIIREFIGEVAKKQRTGNIPNSNTNIWKMLLGANQRVRIQTNDVAYLCYGFVGFQLKF